MKTNAIDRLNTLSPYARKILAFRSGGSEDLIRAELFGAQRFEQHGRSLAQAQTVRKSSGWAEEEGEEEVEGQGEEEEMKILV